MNLTPEKIKECLDKVDFSEITYALEAVNAALALVGERPIKGIVPYGISTQRIAYMNYHPIRRNLLCTRKWEGTLFKEKVSYNSWDGGYRVPSRALRVYSVDGHKPDEENPYFTMNGRIVVLSDTKEPNHGEIEVEYTSDEEDLEQLPEAFKKLFILKLALAFAGFTGYGTSIKAVIDELSKEDN